MAFREVTVVQIREALRRWLAGAGERRIARAIGVDRKTARRYIAAAVELGIDRSGGEGQLTDELIGRLVEAVRPHRTDGHGAAWRSLVAEEEQITKWVTDGLTVVKIGILLERKGVVVPHRTLARFAVERCGAGRRTTTVRVDDPPPGGRTEAMPFTCPACRSMAPCWCRERRPCAVTSTLTPGLRSREHPGVTLSFPYRAFCRVLELIRLTSPEIRTSRSRS
jgi:hypothetical protein